MSSRTNRRLPLLAAASILIVSGCPSTDIGDGDALSRVSVRVSVKPFGEETNGASTVASISADGRFVAFESTATDLTPSDSNNLRDIFVKDRLTGEVDNVSIVDLDTPFPPAQNNSFNPAVSEDGRYVAFLNQADIDAAYSWPASNNAEFNVWVFDRVTRTVVPAVGTSNGWPDASCFDVTISRDGRWVVFSSAATNLGFGDPGGDRQVYAADWQMGTLVLVSHAEGLPGTFANGGSFMPRISADGLYVVFASEADDFDLSDADPPANPEWDIYLGRTDGGDAELVSVDSGGTKGDGFSLLPSISSDGRFCAFTTSSSNLAPGSAVPSVILRDRIGMSTVLVAPSTWVSSPPMFPGGAPCDVSDDGQVVVYKDFDGAGITSTLGQIFAWHAPGTLELVSTEHLTQLPGNLESFNPLLSRDGAWCVYTTASDKIVDDDANGVADVFVRGPLQ